METERNFVIIPFTVKTNSQEKFGFIIGKKVFVKNNSGWREVKNFEQLYRSGITVV